VGALNLATYMLVLAAYSRAPVVIREISVIFAALSGWRWLGEGFGRARTLGAALIFCGIGATAAFG